MMTVGNTKFIDSSNYMPMRLSDLLKAFRLHHTSGKGIFPHLFNRKEHQAYIGPIPSARYYSSEQMKPEEREHFIKWHDDMTQSGFIFDFQREIVKYCRNNVDILQRACLTFRKIFLERGSVCPFVECTTIASTYMKVIRRNFLRGEEIGVIPAGGYRYRDNNSRKAVQWLVWMERKLNQRLSHAGRGREFRITGTSVDRYYETDLENETRRYVLQFHGCFWHGCPSCFRINRERKLNSSTDHGDTIDARYERTLAATWRLRRRGYLVMEKWECDFDRKIRENNEMCDFLENAQIIKNSPLDPRDAFFGGRTGNIATRCDVAGTKKIRYIDVCSLYPYVLKTGAFSIGHPKIYIGEECSELIGVAPDFDFNSLEGLIRCKVLPPRDLFHPVLPYRIRDKLLFALCRSCCKMFSQAERTHSLAEREFEVWQYKVTRYDPDTRRGGLFTEFINSFLQLKQKASGWPNECVDDEARERYECNYWNKHANTEQYQEWKSNHEDQVNHVGLAGKMEVDAMKELLSRSVEKHGVIYINYVEDGDSKTYTGLVNAKPYGDEIEVIKKECHNYSALPRTVLDAIKPIYEDLSNDKLLERRVGGYTQNSNESFNQLIWKIAPKTMHSGAKIVNIAAFLATCTFNDGVTSLLEVMNVLGISVGSGAHLYAAQEDETHITKVELQAQEQTKEGRIRRRQQNLEDMNIPSTVEDLHYGSGIDDFM
ncbi:hypothetical protein ALC57_04462 [Trachymyrmex cornetzi]|uniref:DNA-directed DNA polymerase n=1 Tax=Trachymyrmex cornetzi TaxID=471704 RepID=A0A151JC78_9HYME|nr:hypothetical protein ALC57_04462 [Trachymyrmex cornetzi]